MSESLSPDESRDIEVIPRKEFCKEFGAEYQAGQHVTIIGPTQRGKTRLCHDLLAEVISPEHQAVLLSGKPPGRDPGMNDAAKRLNLRIVETWPPAPNPYYRARHGKHNGYVLRPYQGMKDLEADEANLRTQFRACMISNYASQKPVITVVDEAHQVQNDLKLKREYEAPLMRGAPVNAEWSNIQRGRFMSYLAYDAPEHLFIFFDPDRSNRMRYSEIGGVDPGYIAFITENLNTYRVETGGTISEALYIRRSGPYLAIVDVK